MKTILLLAPLIASLAGSAFAEQKLWTWHPKNQKAFHFIHGMAMHESGAGAFVLSELDGPESKVKFLIVWINPDGKVLMARKFSLPQIEKGKEVMDPWLPVSFTVSFLGPDAIAVQPPDTNGVYPDTRLYKNNGGPPKLKLINSLQTTTFGTNSFAGWLAKDYGKGSISIAGAGTNGEDLYVRDLRSLTAWKL